MLSQTIQRISSAVLVSTDRTLLCPEQFHVSSCSSLCSLCKAPCCHGRPVALPLPPYWIARPVKTVRNTEFMMHTACTGAEIF